MKVLKEYNHCLIIDYDDEAKAFLAWVAKHYGNKRGAFRGVAYSTFEDDGSYEAPSGSYVELYKDSHYMTVYDLYFPFSQIRKLELEVEFLNARRAELLVLLSKRLKTPTT